MSFLFMECPFVWAVVLPGKSDFGRKGHGPKSKFTLLGRKPGTLRSAKERVPVALRLLVRVREW